MSNIINASLEKTLQSYRVYSAPSEMSWKKHYVNEKFSNDDFLLCSPEEQEQFSKRLKECGCTICDNIKMLQGTPSTLYDLVTSLYNPIYKNVLKPNRRVIYSSDNGERPVGKKAFELFRGTQIIDMDLKDKELSIKLKQKIFDSLKLCNWFLGVTLSSSGKGLHVYTKIAVPEDQEPEKARLLYLTNFRHKYSFVYIACMKYAEELGFTSDDLQKWMDLAMFKPQQGAFIGYDEHPLISTHFFEDFIYIGFDNVNEIGCPEIDWVTHPDLKSIFHRWEWFEDTNEEPEVNVIDIGNVNITDNKTHYKHHERWKLANTLVKLFGLDIGYKYLRKITSNSVSDKELRADCVTAARHNKNVDPWAIKRLNDNHGFNIKIDIPNNEITHEELLIKMDTLSDPNIILPSNKYVEFKINKDQYLGNIVDDIMSNLGHITLLEAGPGLGKTEMVKQITSKGNKIMLVMPFTSTIKSKVEEDPDWYYSYGSRKPRLDVEKGLALTLDKFSRLNMQDIKISGFSYIFIDESHLLFMSDYRSIMSRIVDMVRMSEVPVVLMSGTPTGELVFFQDITHIKVIKEETRKKKLHVNIVETPNMLFYHMCSAMAQDIANGKRVLYPSNNGMCYSERVRAGVEFFLQTEQQYFQPLNFRYYKKSQIGEDFMDNINFQKTIKDIQLLMCTSYLSVGVDILDKYNFEIYFSDLCTASEADQWANRLRSNDLFIKLYISKFDSEGNCRYINKFKPMNFKLDDDELRDMHSIIRICNASIERSPIVNNYNPLVSSIIKSNNYVMFDNVTQKYYIDETAYKIYQFEHKYRDFAQQLPVFMKGMKCYGYDITSWDLGMDNVEGTDIFCDLKNCVRLACNDHCSWNTKSINELLDLITYERLPIYRDCMQGMFDLRLGKEWKEDFNKNIITCKNVEMFEKVVPIFLSLSKHFDVAECKEIFYACKKCNGRYNFEALNRFRSLFNLINADENKRLDIPIKEFMDKTYKFTNKKVTTRKKIDKFINDFVMDYALRDSTKEILIGKSEITLKRMNELFDKIFRCLVKTSHPNANKEIEMERVEILWKTREQKFQEINNNLYILQDFIDELIPTELHDNPQSNPENVEREIIPKDVELNI